ncbi:MAG: hypothetical protein GOV00_01700 [Candidatus Altiarchaeota archaeon]|nr:hypothetical protein [Candidatus Altiarchaeota archaeon]
MTVRIYHKNPISNSLIRTKARMDVAMELIILGIFAIVGVLLLKFLVGAGDTSSRLPPPPSPYTSMPGYYGANYAPPPRPPKVIKRKIIIMPESTVRRHTRRKRRLRT